MDPDKTVTQAELAAMFTISNYCKIDTLQLSLQGTASPTTVGAPWVSFILLDGNNDLKINFNGVISVNTTYDATLWMTTTGGIVTQKDFRFHFFIPNFPPTLNPPTLNA